jgi:hypothetical protein
MKKHSRHLLALLIIGMTFLSGCAKKDLIIDYGKGDSIRLVGGGDNFDCDDPLYTNAKKVRTWTMQFADGTTKYLCSLEGATSETSPIPPDMPLVPVASPGPTRHSRGTPNGAP